MSAFYCCECGVRVPLRIHRDGSVEPLRCRVHLCARRFSLNYARKQFALMHAAVAESGSGVGSSSLSIGNNSMTGK